LEFFHVIAIVIVFASKTVLFIILLLFFIILLSYRIFNILYTWRIQVFCFSGAPGAAKTIVVVKQAVTMAHDNILESFILSSSFQVLLLPRFSMVL